MQLRCMVEQLLPFELLAQLHILGTTINGGG